MNMTAADEAILKTDVLGRVKTPKERCEAWLDEFEQSGLSGQEFAGVVGIKYQTFTTWAQKRRRARGTYPRTKAPAPANQMRWLEAVVAATPAGRPTAGMVLELPGGARAAVADEKQAALAAVLLRALGRSG
jgi:hypothetical protein